MTSPGDGGIIGCTGKPRQEWTEALKSFWLMAGTLCVQPNADTMCCHHMFAPHTRPAVWQLLQYLCHCATGQVVGG